MSNTPADAKHTRHSTHKRGLLPSIISIGFHGLAVLILAASSAALFSTDITMSALRWAWQHDQAFSSVALGLAGHLGLCALVWATIVFIAGRVRRSWSTAETATSKPFKLGARPIGSVLTETIIVLPVALVLIMGIAQLALINIAATLADLAVIQSARTAWVWMPEAVDGRFNVDRSMVKEKARVQAAAVLAPVASSDFGEFRMSAQPDYAKTFQKTMGAIYGAQVEGGGGNDVGSYSQTQAEQKLTPGRRTTPEEFSFFLAFDATTFEERSARKFFNSWAHTEIELADSGERIGVTMTYHHFCLMPLVAGIFGEYKQINGKNGYFLTIERKYTLRKQVKVNAKQPRR